MKYLKPILLFTLFLLSVPALANTGKVTYMSGDVKVNGQPMSKSYQVKGGDTITTGNNGKVNIVMADKSVLDLEPNSKFQLERFNFNKKAPEKSRSIMNLLSGGFRYISGLVGRTNHENATIKMGTATAGIRGSVASFTFRGQVVNVTTLVGETRITIGGKTYSYKSGTTVASAGGAAPTPASATEAAAQIQAAMTAIANGEGAPAGTDPVFAALSLTAVVAEADVLKVSTKQVQDATKAVLSDLQKTNPDIALGAAALTSTVAPPTMKGAVQSGIATTPGLDPKAVKDAIDSSVTTETETTTETDPVTGETTTKTETTTSYNEGDSTQSNP